jgi:cytoskeletal protein CcmA (bactofilin family)
MDEKFIDFLKELYTIHPVSLYVFYRMKNHMKKYLVFIAFAFSALVATAESIYVDGSRKGDIKSDGEIYLDGSRVGEIKADGDVYIHGSRAGTIKRDGDIYMDGSRVGSVKPDGDVYKGGSRVGHVNADGDVYKNGSRIGNCKGVRVEWAAAVYFFFFEDALGIK